MAIVRFPTAGYLTELAENVVEIGHVTAWAIGAGALIALVPWAIALRLLVIGLFAPGVTFAGLPDC